MKRANEPWMCRIARQMRPVEGAMDSAPWTGPLDTTPYNPLSRHNPHALAPLMSRLGAAPNSDLYSQR